MFIHSKYIAFDTFDKLDPAYLLFRALLSLMMILRLLLLACRAVPDLAGTFIGGGRGAAPRGRTFQIRLRAGDGGGVRAAPGGPPRGRRDLV